MASANPRSPVDPLILLRGDILSQAMSLSEMSEICHLSNRTVRSAYIVIGIVPILALCLRPEFEEKVRTGRLTADDFVMIECRYNDPEAGFFVMRADVPHGEAIVPAAGKPAPSFYVTESRDLPLDVIDLRKYRLRAGS